MLAFSVSGHCFICVCVFAERKVPGGEQAQMKETAGETLTERTLTAMIVAIAMIDVIVMIAAVSAEIETVGMTVITEALPGILMKVRLA